MRQRTSGWIKSVQTFLCCALVVGIAGPASAHHNQVVDKLDRGVSDRVSVSSKGHQGNSHSAWAYCQGGHSASDDGRFVAFASTASNLHPADVNGKMEDVFVFDRTKRKIQLVSAMPSGLGAPYPEPIGDYTGPICDLATVPIGSFRPMISGNGRYVAFVSNLPMTGQDDPEAPPWPVMKVFVRDVKKGSTELVSRTWNRDPALADSGFYGLSISDDGRFVAFNSDATNMTKDACSTLEIAPGVEAPIDLACDQTYVHDRTRDVTKLVSRSTSGKPANAYARFPSISGNGRFVAFESPANNLVPGDNNICQESLVGLVGPCRDVFVHDLRSKKTELISVSRNGSSANGTSQMSGWFAGHQALSDDGREVVFSSAATDLVPANMGSNDTTGYSGEYLWDRKTRRMERVSVTSAGEMLDARMKRTSITDDGRHVLTFMSGTCPVCAPQRRTHHQYFFGDFLKSRATGQADFITSAYQGKPEAAIDITQLGSDASFVVGISGNPKVVANDTNEAADVFVREIGNYPLGTGPHGGFPRGKKEPDDRICVAPEMCVPPNGALSWHADTSGTSVQQAADLYGASLAYRPELGDLFAAIELEHMGPLSLGPAGLVSGGVPSLLYGLRFEVGNKSYEVRATSLLGGTFELFDCTGAGHSCTKLRTLTGGYGTTGERVVFSLPLAAIGVTERGRLSRVTAFSAVGTGATGASKVLDTLRLK